MRIINKIDTFKDNVLFHRPQKKRLWHWTGSRTASSAINWLDKRIDGTGTIGYHFIIDKNGYIYMLADPHKSFMQSSGLGKTFDSTIIAIAFAILDETDDITKEQYESAKYLINKTNKEFHILGDIHHAQINSHKIDFPKWLWKDIQKELNI